MSLVLAYLLIMLVGDEIRLAVPLIKLAPVRGVLIGDVGELGLLIRIALVAQAVGDLHIGEMPVILPDLAVVMGPLGLILGLLPGGLGHPGCNNYITNLPVLSYMGLGTKSRGLCVWLV